MMVQFRLVENPPSARTVGVVVEGITDFAAERGCCARMRDGGPRVGVERSVEDLGDQVGRGVEHVLIGGTGTL